jgi:manganese-dependent inorganic pyrophosphatase
LQTSAPILFHAEPVGSSCTIVTDFLLYHSIAIPDNIAGLLLAGILSDTVIFKSPTTTEKDKLLANQLAKQTGLDIQEFGLEVKKAKSSIAKMTADEVIMNDFKEFDRTKFKYGVGQIEIVDYAEALDRRNEIMNELDKTMNDGGYDLVILMVTNIMEEATRLWFKGDEEIIKKAFGKEPKNNEVYLPGVMSRKLQVVPKIEEVL